MEAHKKEPLDQTLNLASPRIRDQKHPLKADEESCSCGGHDHEGHCHDHSHEGEDSVTLVLEDGMELICPIIDLFEVNEQAYLAVFHPIDETALCYRFFDYEDGTVELTPIEDEEEETLVYERFMVLQDALEEED